MQITSTALTPFNPKQANRSQGKTQVAKRLKSQANLSHSGARKGNLRGGDWIEAEWSEWQEDSEEGNRLAPWLIYKKVQNALHSHQAVIDFYA